MDVYGCSLPNTRLDAALLVIALALLALCALLGLPFLIWIAVCGESLCLAH